jgi:hypothetical protein
MTYSVLMDLASQREHQIAARARSSRFDSAPTRVPGRRGKRERARVSTRLRTLAGRA